MPSPSNYPPGVSGNEPEITGQWPADPHNPWQVTYAGVGQTERFAVQHMGSEELVLLYDDLASEGGMDRDAAEELARQLNELTAKPYCCVNERGTCLICGDYSAHSDSDYPFLKPVKKANGTYYWLASTSLD
jgi:hypothetical protein